MSLDILVNTGSENGLLPDGTKPLPEPVLTNHQKVVWYSFQNHLLSGNKDIHTHACLEFAHLKSQPHLTGDDELIGFGHLQAWWLPNLVPMYDVQCISGWMHMAHAFSCFIVWSNWFYPNFSGSFHLQSGNLMTAPVPVKQPWRIWVNKSHDYTNTDDITTTKQSTTKMWAYLWDILYAQAWFNEAWWRHMVTELSGVNIADYSKDWPSADDVILIVA